MEEKDKIINKLIAADDLHWSEEENRYVSLSDDEINLIIMTCVEQGIKEEKYIYKMVKWAGQVRVGSILLNNFLNNRIKVSGFDDEEPFFNAK